MATVKSLLNAGADPSITEQVNKEDIVLMGDIGELG